MTDLELFDEAVEHHVAPAMPSFLDDFWRAAEQRQRSAARRWRRAALVLAVVAAAATAAAGVLASSRVAGATTLDQTWSCPVGWLGGGYHVEWRTSVNTPSTPAFFFFTPQTRASTQDFGPPALRLDTRPAKVTWGTPMCARSHASVPLTAQGLTPETVVTTHFVGYTASTCHSSARILLHAHVTLARGNPTRAKVVVVDQRSRKPIGYVDWSPTRIATWTSKCDSY